MLTSKIQRHFISNKRNDPYAPARAPHGVAPSRIRHHRYKYHWPCTHALPHSSAPALAAAARASLATIRVQAARSIAMAATAALLLAVSLVLAAVASATYCPPPPAPSRRRRRPAATTGRAPGTR
jgi:hypothetical protein